MTLGADWISKLRARVPLFDHAKNQAEILAAIDDREKRSATFFDGLKLTDVPEGILSCVERGSNSLAVACPEYVLLTHSLELFLHWAKSELLHVSIFQVRCEHSSTGMSPIVYLNITPQTPDAPLS